MSHTADDLTTPPLLDTVAALLLDMVCIISADGCFAELKGGWTAVFSYDRQELVGIPLTSLVHPHDLHHTDEMLRSLREGTPVVSFSNRYRCKDGSYKWIEWRAMSLPQGGTCASARDITAQKHLEKVLRDQERLFRGLFHNAPVGIYQSDAQGANFIANERWYEHSGIAREGTDGDAGISMSEEDRERVASMWKHAMESGKEWSSEYSYRTADGRQMWVHGTALQLLDDQGDVIGYLGCNIDITERKEAEEALRQSEDRFRLAMEATNDGVWDVEFPGEGTYYSPGCYRLLQYDPELEKRSMRGWLELVHPEDREHTWKKFAGCMANGAPFESEFRIRAKDGSWKWLLSRGRAISRSESGAVRRIVGTFQEISQRKAMEEMLRMEHGFLNLITLTSPIGIIFFDPDGRIAFVNRRVEEIAGMSREEMMDPGGSFPQWRVTAPNGDPLSEEELPVRRVRETGQAQLDVCVSFQRPDGSHALLAVNAAPLVDADGTTSGVVATVEDITARKQAEQRMAESEWLLRESQRIAQLGGFVYDADTGMWQGSDKIEEIAGLPPDFPRNLSKFFEIVHPDHRDLLKEKIEVSLEKAMDLELEYKIIRPSDGAQRWVKVFAEPIYQEQGKVKRVLGAMQDITERKVAEEAIQNLNDELDLRVMERTAQLNAAKREMESFSYSVSHDLRAPLRHINSYCSILTEDFQEWLPQQARYYLDRICAASSRMGKLIDDLLQLSRVNRMDMKQVNFRISRIAQEVAEMLREGAPMERQVDFIIADGLSARGDRNLVRQVLENLMGNAMKYTSKQEKTCIEFGRTHVDGKSVFFVKDDGAGFDMAYADKLFQPFQRLHGAEFEGTGIGLATVKRIVERHGGRVWAKGEVGRGATFYFTLPGGSGKTEPHATPRLSP